MALKLLFHPHDPKRFLGMTIQGVFPKRKLQIANSLGRIVGQELLSFTDIEKTLTNPQSVQKIMPLVDAHLDDFLRNKLKRTMPVISMFIGEKTILELKAAFLTELEELFPLVMKNYIGQIRTDLDLEKIVSDKISNFSSDRLEQMLNQILTKEFRFVDVIGAALGFFIGIVQILLTLLVK